MKNIILYFSLFLLTSACAQTKAIYPAMYNGRKNSEYRLEGPVKTVYTKYSYKKNDLNRYHNFRLWNDLPKLPSVIEFYENGLVKTMSNASYRSDTTKTYIPINVKQSLNIEYNDKDVEELINKKSSLKYYQNVHTDLLSLQPSKYIYTYPIDGDLEKSLIEYIYKYSYDEKGRPKEIKEYNPSHLEDFTPLNHAKEEDLLLTTIFHYNDKDQVIKQSIIGGTKFVGRFGYYDYTFLYASLHLEKGQLDHVFYNYDDKGRIKEAFVYDFSDEEIKPIFMKAVYQYHPTEDYVEKTDNLINLNGRGINDYPTNRWISYFNEQGDIIKREFILDNSQIPSIETVTRYYEYEYDQYNNWKKCYLYLEGKKVADDPTLIVERKIEYYE